MIMGASFAFCIAPSVMATLICTHANYLCRIAISLVAALVFVKLIALSVTYIFACSTQLLYYKTDNEMQLISIVNPSKVINQFR